MTTYFLLFCFFLLLSFVYILACYKDRGSRVRLRSNVFFMLPLLLLVVLMGFRHEVGTDYWNYVGLFERFESNDSFVTERFEVGFLALMAIVSWLGLSGNYFLFILYFLTIAFFWGAIRLVRFESASMLSLSLILFLGLGPVFSATNTVRQDLAVSLVVFLCVLLAHRKFVATVAASLFGMLFHFSAPVSLLYNFIPNKRLGVTFWLPISIVCLVFSSNLFSIIFSVLENNYEVLSGFGDYFRHDGVLREGSGLGIRIVFEVFIFLFLSLYVSKIDPKGLWYFNIAFAGVLMSYVFKDYAMLMRIAAYFSVFKFLAIPWFVSAFKGVEKQIFFLFFIVYSLSLFARSATADQFSPYKMIFFY